MSETPKTVDLDAALREWPSVDKTTTEWEEMTRTVVEHARSARTGASAAYVDDENLFAAPLGQTPEDGHNSAAPLPAGAAARGAAETAPAARTRAEDKPMTMPADRDRDRRSLQDLAKMAQLTPPPPSTKSAPSGVQRATEAKKDDSGIVDLAAASASDPAAEIRAKQTPLASQGLFDDEPASVRPPPVVAQPAPSLVPVPISAPVASASAPIATVAQSAVAQAVPAKKKSGGGVVIALVVGGLVAVSAVAAGMLFVMKSRAAGQLMTGTAAPATGAVAVTPSPATPEGAPTLAATDPTPPTEAVDPSGGAAGGKVALGPKGGATAKASPKVANAGPPPAAAGPQKEEPAKLAQKDLPKSDGPPGDLGQAIAASAGDPKKSADQVPAAGPSGPQFAPGSVPQKPSQGAVTGALGAVLPQARACLGPDDPISRAVVVFGSNGAVQSVSVSGGAVGKPAEGCIKGALTKAKVAPFAEATYTAPITIRH